MTLAEKLAEQGIRPPSFGNGSYKIRCPKCSDSRKDKNDPCLSLTISDEGAVWNCWNRCGFVGGVHDRDPAEVIPLKTRLTPDTVPEIGPLWAEALAFFKQRKINPETLRLAGVGSCYWFIPAKAAKVQAVAFPYREAGGKTVNIKFRTLDKNFAQVKGAKKILFGWGDVDISSNQLVLCEGEMDQLSLLQAQIQNPCSVPDGASDRKWEFLDDPDLAKFTRIVIAGDADEKGEALGNELARRFGFERCWKAEWPNGCKDANDVLVQYGEGKLFDCIAEAKPFPISGLHLIDEYEEQIWELYHGGRKRGVSSGWAGMDKHMTFRGGELSVVTGIPSSGKSEFVDAININLATAHAWTFAVCSFENPPEEHFAKYAEKHLGVPFFDGPTRRMTETEVRSCIAWARERFFLIRADDEAPTIDWILEKARVAVIRHGIKGLVIDPYNEIEHQRPSGSTETEYVSDMLDKVKRFARNHDVHVWFVAHPAKPMRTKEGDYPVPSLYDISGSANWNNKADIGVVVERDHSEGSRKVIIHVKKVRFKSVGLAGSVTLQFDRSTGRYSEPPAYQAGRNWDV